MNDELETRLHDAFRSGSLPAAPGRLIDHLNEVTSAPLVAAGQARRGRRPWSALAVAAVLLIGGAVAVSIGSRGPSPLPNVAPSTPSAEPTTGVPTRLIYEAQWTVAVRRHPAVLADLVSISQQRIDATGLVGGQVTTDDQGRIVIEIPVGVDPDPIRRLVGPTGLFAFVPVTDIVERGARLDPAIFPALFDSGEIGGASVLDDQNGQRTLQIILSGTGGEKFGAYTAAHIGSVFALTLDEIVIAAPVINEGIPDGIVQITFPTAEADRTELARLATLIKFGPLPVALAEVTTSPAPGASHLPGGSAPGASAEPFKLNLNTDDFGCDTIRMAYRSVVMRIDPSAADPVSAVTDTGLPLKTFWSSTFQGGTKSDPVVYDRNGVVVAFDGTLIDLPNGTFPTLAGYFVCPGADAIRVFDQPPG